MIELTLARTGRSTEVELKINVFYLPLFVRLTGEATPRTVFLLGVAGYMLHFLIADLRERYVAERKME